MFLPGVIAAAELRGRIWDAATDVAPPGGTLRVHCPGFSEPTELSGNGNYSFRNVPPQVSCTLTVSTNAGEGSRSVNVNGPVVRFDAELRKIGNRLLLIPK